MPPRKTSSFQKEEGGWIVLPPLTIHAPPPELTSPEQELVTEHVAGLLVRVPPMPTQEEDLQRLEAWRMLVNWAVDYRTIMDLLLRDLQRNQPRLLKLWSLSDPAPLSSLASLADGIGPALREALARRLHQEFRDPEAGAPLMFERALDIIREITSDNLTTLAAQGLGLAALWSSPTDDFKTTWELGLAYADQIWKKPRNPWYWRTWRLEMARWIVDYLKQWAGGPAADEDLWDDLLDKIPPGKDVRDYLVGREDWGFRFPGIEEAFKRLRGG